MHPEAKVDSSARIGPFCVIEEGAYIGPGCLIDSHVVIKKGTSLGASVSIGSFSVIGGLPQDLNFNQDSVSTVIIGDATVIREGVTIHRSKYAGAKTVIANNCYLMAQCHVGHDCEVGPYAIITNNVLLAGHVQVGAYANIGGGACVHQFVRIGSYSMLGGFSAVVKDIPPYCLSARRNELIGLNLVGLRRHGFSPVVIQDIKNAYQLMFSGEGTYVQKATDCIQKQLFKTPEGANFFQFFLESKRGCLNPSSKIRS